MYMYTSLQVRHQFANAPNLPNYSIVVIAFAFCQLTTNLQNPVCCSCHCCDEQVCRACTQRHTCMSSPREGPRLYCCARYNLPGSEKGRGGEGGGGGQIIRDSKKSA